MDLIPPASGRPIRPATDAEDFCGCPDLLFQIPLVLAVVGHRDPIASEVPRLRDLFREDLQQLFRTLPHTPLLLLNGLASGMDSEAAEVFLSEVELQHRLRPAGPRHRLVAALPRTLDHFRQDFEDPDALHRFDALLARCQTVLDPSSCPDLRAFLPSDQELPVPECYGQHGLFLVRHCYLLVAFHNGFETMAIGGTAQAVALQKGEVHPLFLSAQEITASQEPGALLEIDTPRHRTTFPQPRTPRTYWLRSRCQRGRRLAAAPRALQLSDLLDTPRRMEMLNRQLQRTGRPDHVPQPWDPSGSPLRWLMDRESSRCKRQSRRCSGAVLLIGWLLSLSLAAYPWTSLTLMLFSGLLLRLPLRSTGPKRRFLACRALAECLTVQDLWVSLGVERDVADLFDSRVDSGLDWVRTVLRSCRLQQLCRSATGPVGDDQMEESATMAHQWLTDELRWLERAEERLLLQDRWLTGSAVLALALSLLLAISPFLGSATGWLHPARLPGLPALAVASGPHLQAWLATAALITGVALLAWRHVLDPAPIRARYRRSRLLFQRALQAFDQAWLSDRRDPLRLLRLRAALEAVGQDKLAELNAWIAGQLRGVVRVDG